ncbi:hypothetical protein BGW36DRAFT_387035 [Talaromyces proteolyticus]|uniref:DUF202 domain-containing protein n=1 Tax=Talaromyces proteolyticus TaxID=1131652 RepID=A0AAD4KGX6_9EURO|nr:uncharacterized protein BGW36DRAFT_387035 [Talaromyces proteolyticus]KAH8692118.1 hypothetical protein BGW36DRAFT_387035 [Talaromyces proteolyticus]
MAEATAPSIPQTLDDDTEEPSPLQDQPQSEQPHPQRFLSRTESNDNSRPREATELDEIATASACSSASLSSGEYRIVPRRTATSTSSNTVNASHKHTGRLQPLRRFWSRHVALVVSQKGNRDYFALERTFLAYVRTSAAFSMQGVLVAQLFRLQVEQKTRFDFYTVGIPLSIAYQCCAIVVALMGAYRFWRQQNAIARGKVIAGGWEINSMGVLAVLAALALFALAVAIIVELSIS